MNKLFFAMALLFVGMSVNAQHLGSEYRLKKVIPVAGRQELLSIANYLLCFRHQSTVQIRQTGKSGDEERSAVPKSRNCQPLR